MNIVYGSPEETVTDYGTGRVCAAGCGAYLSRYNSGDRCRSCSRPDPDLMRLGQFDYHQEVEKLGGSQ